MLAQHLVTKPVFDALFENHEFTAENPISQAMQTMVERFNQNAAFERERETLSSAYASIQMRASGLKSAAAKQNLIKDLYDKFFKKAFPTMAEKLGIVFTPTEVVDYILRYVLNLVVLFQMKVSLFWNHLWEREHSLPDCFSWG